MVILVMEVCCEDDSIGVYVNEWTMGGNRDMCERTILLGWHHPTGTTDIDAPYTW